MGQKEKDGALNEVRLLASINIHYVVGYHGAFFDNTKQTLCIVMEYCDGGDLQNKIIHLPENLNKYIFICRGEKFAIFSIIKKQWIIFI